MSTWKELVEDMRKSAKKAAGNEQKPKTIRPNMSSTQPARETIESRLREDAMQPVTAISGGERRKVYPDQSAVDAKVAEETKRLFGKNSPDAADLPLTAQLMQSAVKIQRLLSGAAQNTIEAGQELLAVKAKLKHGEWGAWLRDECQLSERMAQRLMGVAERFKNDNLSDLDIDSSALYLLAAPSTPQSVSDGVLTRARGGERITHSDAIAAIKQHEPKRKPDGDGKPQKSYNAAPEPTKPKPEPITPATDGDIAKYLLVPSADLAKALKKVFDDGRHISLEECRMIWLNLGVWLSDNDTKWYLSALQTNWELKPNVQRQAREKKKAGK